MRNLEGAVCNQYYAFRQVHISSLLNLEGETHNTLKAFLGLYRLHDLSRGRAIPERRGKPCRGFACITRWPVS